MTPDPFASAPVPNVVTFGDVELEIIPTDSQTELQDVPSTRDDDDASTKLYWWNQRWSVVIVIVVGDDMSISRKRLPIIRRGFFSALEELEVPLTGSKQE